MPVPVEFPELVGRGVELARVRHVATNRGPTERTLLVTGRRGSGKSTLLRHALQGFDGDVMWLSGNDASGQSPWDAMRNVRSTIRAVKDFDDTDRSIDYDQAIAHDADPVAIGRMVAERYCQMPRRARPVVLVADDIHRCDPFSLAVITYLAHYNHTFDVSYVFTCPDEHVPAAMASLDRLVLPGFDEHHARTAVQLWSAHPTSADVARRLRSAADGNPLLLRELTGQLNASQLAGDLPLPLPLPVTAAAAVVEHDTLDALGADEVYALACFACERQVPPVVLRRVVSDSVVASLRQRRLIVAEHGAYAPARAALGWLALDALDPGLRDDLWAALASAWSGVDEVQAVLHASRQSLPDPGLLDLARKVLDHDGPPTDPVLVEALAVAVTDLARPASAHDWVRLATASEGAGHLLESLRAIENGVQALDVDEAGLVALLRWRGLLSELLDDADLAVPSPRFFDAVDSFPPSLRFTTLTCTAHNALVSGAVGQCRVHLDRARQSGRSAGLLDRALWRLVDVEWQQATGEHVVPDARREAVLRWWDVSGRTSWHVDAWCVRILLDSGAPADARQLLLDAQAAYRETPGHAAAVLLGVQLQVDLAGHRVDAALRAVGTLQADPPSARLHIPGLGPALMRLETAAGLEDGTLGLPAQRGFASEQRRVAQARAQRLLLDGRSRDAALALQAATVDAPSASSDERWSAHADIVEALVAAGDPHAAEAASRHPDWPEPTSIDAQAARARAAALLAPTTEILGAFAHALSLAEPDPFQQARALLAYARRLAQLGSPDRAQAARAEAATVFELHGLHGWARHAQHLAIEPSAAQASRFGLYDNLDPLEVQVVRLLLVGNKNRQVADQLYLSLRSLEKVLTRLYAKAGVSTKTQLLAALRADGSGSVAEPHPSLR